MSIREKSEILENPRHKSYAKHRLSDFADVSHKTIQAIEDRLNNRLRKVLGYKIIPLKVFFTSENNSITSYKSIALQS